MTVTRHGYGLMNTVEMMTDISVDLFGNPRDSRCLI